jgi:hypothetical protein
MYEQLETDKALETKGVEINYGSFRVTLARAGGSNKKYERLLDARAKPHERARKTGTMDNDVAIEILREVYADSIVLHWETKNAKGEWEIGIEAKSKKAGDPIKLVPFTRDNVVQAMIDLPELFMWFKEDAEKLALYLIQYQEADTGN